MYLTKTEENITQSTQRTDNVNSEVHLVSLSTFCGDRINRDHEIWSILLWFYTNVKAFKISVITLTYWHQYFLETGYKKLKE
jgi:hypothetical protein